MSTNTEKKDLLRVGDLLWGLVEKGVSTDCVVQVHSQPTPKMFVLHKMVLIEFSPIFKDVIDDDKTGIIKINDVDPRIMEIALKHMYACALDKTTNCIDLRGLLIVADKYNITTLKEECAEFACKHLMIPENVLNLLNLMSYMTQSNVVQDLEKNLFKIFEDETEKCITGDDKLEISEDTLLKLLAREKLMLGSELDLIKFTNRWAIAKIKKEENLENVADYKLRNILEPQILPLIRFVTLKKEEFHEFLCFSNWLTTEEKQEISYVQNCGNFSTNFPCNLSRKTTTRCIKQTVTNEPPQNFPDLFPDGKLSSGSLIARPAKSNLLHYYNASSNSNFTFQFQLDDDKYALVGVQLFTCKSQNTNNYYVESRNIQISLKSDIIAQKTATEGLAKYNHFFTTLFDKPIPLQKNVAYTFLSSYGYSGNVKFFEPKDEIAMESLNLNISLAGDIGPVRALIFKKKQP